jgi:hypothetical protein
MDHLGVILIIFNSNRITILIITELLHTLYYQIVNHNKLFTTTEDGHLMAETRTVYQ